MQDIRDLFPEDCNPFYAGFGNRDTDEISYLKVGIPKGKIFIINPKVILISFHLVFEYKWFLGGVILYNISVFGMFGIDVLL